MNKIVLILVSLLIVSSCGSRKKNKKIPITNSPIEFKDTQQTASDLLQNTLLNWTYFSSKLSIQQDLSPSFNNLSGNIRMLKDSLIWISVSALSFEGGRILINKDSTVFLDKINSEYTVFQNKDLSKYIGVEANVTELQNLLLSRPIFELEKYKVLNLSPFLSILFTQNFSKATHHYSLTNSIIDSTVLIDQKNKKYVKVNYSDYTKVSEQNLASKIALINYFGKTIQKNEIIIKYLSPEFPSEQTFPFKIPTNYKKKNINE